MIKSTIQEKKFRNVTKDIWCFYSKFIKINWARSKKGHKFEDISQSLNVLDMQLSVSYSLFDKAKNENLFSIEKNNSIYLK